MSDIIRFSRRTEYAELSNFTETKLHKDNFTFGSVEAMFQSYKPKDTSMRQMFQFVTASNAKRMGKSVELREDWEYVKYECMLTSLQTRYEQDEEFRNLLISTNDRYICEDTTSWHDNTWGCCSCNRCTSKVSCNLLGIALMEIRARNNPDLSTIIFTIDGEMYAITVEELKDPENKYGLVDYINRYAD